MEFKLTERTLAALVRNALAPRVEGGAIRLSNDFQTLMSDEENARLLTATLISDLHDGLRARSESARRAAIRMIGAAANTEVGARLVTWETLALVELRLKDALKESLQVRFYIDPAEEACQTIGAIASKEAGAQQLLPGTLELLQTVIVQTLSGNLAMAGADAICAFTFTQAGANLLSRKTVADLQLAQVPPCTLSPVRGAKTLDAIKAVRPQLFEEPPPPPVAEKPAGRMGRLWAKIQTGLDKPIGGG